MWLKAEYEFGSLFSYRVPGFSSQYALSSPLPGPSTIKMALVATAIETSGDIKLGEQIFDIVKHGSIRLSLPRNIALSNLLIKRLKKKKDADELETTYGIRGYVHFSEPLKIYIQVKLEVVETIKELLRKIRRFGTSDSLAYCLTEKVNMEEDPPEGSLTTVSMLTETNENRVIIPVRDINKKATFDEVNIYSPRKKGKKEEALITVYYLIPVISVKHGKNWTVYTLQK